MIEILVFLNYRGFIVAKYFKDIQNFKKKKLFIPLKNIL